MPKYLKSSIKSALIGFTTISWAGIVGSSMTDSGPKEIKKWQGFQGLLSTNTLKFPNDYITFVIIGGLIWPYLKNKFGWSNKFLYLLGTCAVLYILAPDGSINSPKKSIINKNAKKSSPYYSGWYVNNDVGRQVTMESFISEYSYDMWQRGYSVIPANILYGGIFWYLVYNNIINYNSKTTKDNDYIFPFIKPE